VNPSCIGARSGANLGAIAEGADLVFVAGFINRLTGVFAANPKIKSPLARRRQRQIRRLKVEDLIDEGIVRKLDPDGRF
jgi:hypothetical protein